jgi:hypothetical protein
MVNNVAFQGLKLNKIHALSLEQASGNKQAAPPGKGRAAWIRGRKIARRWGLATYVGK